MPKPKSFFPIRQGKLSKGVSKLTEARDVVRTLKSEAASQEETLAEKQHEANEALQMITDTMRNANLQKGQVQDKPFSHINWLPIFQMNFAPKN